MAKKPTYEELEQQNEKLKKEVLMCDRLAKGRERFFSFSLDMIGTGNLDGSFTKISSSFEEILGYTEEEFLKEPFLSFVHPEDVNITADTLGAAAEGKKSTFIENRYKCKDGSYKWIEWKVQNLIEEERFITIGRDISERKRAEKELKKYRNHLEELVTEKTNDLQKLNEDLKKSETRFRDMAQSSSDWIWEVDARGRYTYVSDGVENVLGYLPEELLGKTPYDLMAEGEVERLYDLISRLLVDKKPIGNLENLNVGKDGSNVLLLTSGVPVFDDDGSFLGYRGVDKDITKQKKSEDELRKNEAKYRSLFESAGDANFIMGVSEEYGVRFIDCNRRTLALFGCNQREQIVGRPPEDFSPPIQPDGTSSEEKARQHTLAAMAGNPQTFEWQHRRLDGTLFFVEVVLNRIDVKGDPQLLAVVRDITNRKRAQEALRESEERFRGLIDLSSDWIWEIDVQGKYTYADPKVLDFLGYEVTEVVGKDITSFMSEEDKKNVPSFIKESMETMAAFSHYETRQFHKDGHELIVDTSGTPFYDTKGNFAGWRGLDADITEKKRAEDILHRQSFALEQAMNGIAIVGMTGVAEFINSAWAKMHGYEPEEMEGNRISLMCHTEEQRIKEAMPFIETVRETGECAAEVNHVKKDGTEFPTKMSANVLKDGDGKDVGVVLIIRDITKRKLAERALEDAQHELVEKAHKAGMADIATGTLHNVGNILNSVKASAEMISRITESSFINGFKKANSMLRENIECLDEFILQNPKGKMLMQYYLKLEDGFSTEQTKTIEHLERLTDKVNAIEEVISAQQGYAGVSAYTEEFAITDIVEDALTMQSGSTERYNIKIVKDFNHDIPKVMVQRAKLVHILINLIKNARESIIEARAEEKNMTVSIKSHDNAVFVKFRDTGTGIATSNLEKIFSHGFTTKKSGHGFGLHSSANYMKEMGSRMWAESEGEGKGATFILRFPHPVAV